MSSEKNISVWVVFSVCSAAVLGGVLYGVLTQREEPGFFDGAPTWQRLPITVSVGRYSSEGTLYENADRKLADRIVGRINNQIGTEVLRLIDLSFAAHKANAANAADIAVEMGVPWDVGRVSDEGGRAELRHHATHAVGCDVIVSSMVAWALEGALLHHELGHCLGLADDTLSTSIMYQQASERTVGREFTSHDADLLRSRYVTDFDGGGE